MIRLTDATGLFGAALVIAVTGLMAGRVAQWSSGTARVAALAGLLTIAMIPIDGLPVAAYLRGLIGDLSVTAVVLLVAESGSRVLHIRRPAPQQMLPLCGMVLVCALGFYPMTLGATLYDPYRAGYDSFGFAVAVALVGLVAWLQGSLWITLCIALAMLGFATGWYASTNLWDYLIDPLLALYSLAYLSAYLLRTFSGGRGSSGTKP